MCRSNKNGEHRVDAAWMKTPAFWTWFSKPETPKQHSNSNIATRTLSVVSHVMSAPGSGMSSTEVYHFGTPCRFA